MPPSTCARIDIRIYGNAAIDRRHDPVDFEASVPADRDIGDHRDKCLEALVHGDAASATFGKFLAVIAFFRREIEHGQMARMSLEKFAPELRAGPCRLRGRAASMVTSTA